MSATENETLADVETPTNAIPNFGRLCIVGPRRPVTTPLGDGIRLEVRPTVSGCGFDVGCEITATDLRGPDLLTTTSPLASLEERAEDISARLSPNLMPDRADGDKVRGRFRAALTRLAESADVLVSLDPKGVSVYEATEAVEVEDGSWDVTVTFRHEGDTYPHTFSAGQWDRDQHDVGREGRDRGYEAARIPQIEARQKYDDPHTICRPEDADRWQTLKKIWGRMANAEGSR